MKPEFIGISIAGLLIGYKACVYCSALYQLKKEKRKKIVDFQKVVEYKEKVGDK